MPERAPRRDRDRPRGTAHWAVVLAVLFLTFFAMLAAIYWTVESAKV